MHKKINVKSDHSTIYNIGIYLIILVFLPICWKQHGRECLLFIIIIIFSFLVAVERSHVLSVELHRGHQEVGLVPEITGVRVCCCETGLGQVWI